MGWWANELQKKTFKTPFLGLVPLCPVTLDQPHVLFRVYLTQSVYNVVAQTSVPEQIRRRIVYYYWYKEQVDECVGELTFTKPLYKHFLWDRCCLANPTLQQAPLASELAHNKTVVSRTRLWLSGRTP